MLNMSQYPFRHSTYFTGRDPVYTSELPPMNSTEDILQDIFMRDRNTVYVARPKKNAFKKAMSYVKVSVILTLHAPSPSLRTRYNTDDTG
ncbi:hypothetical protein CVT25_009003 [Psilocybe cyanescens]|uniref:Uncharacterized protein n=1 Tax=Psilocybe cyanescens TaxID=93625 RepID=A0A409XN58_PSICY|nr:hypothetical protein CVT25_009003 [Psilocybe cyanescens]